MPSRSVMAVALLVISVLSAGMAAGQTVSPPVAEYRGKAQGMFELRNDNDFALATVLEVTGFSVDEAGSLKYEPLPFHTKVDLVESSFVIKPHESHFVFYKATTSAPNAWFTILSTLTRASADHSKMRINIVLPHVVYLNQKDKLRKADVGVDVKRIDGKLQITVANHSAKLGRVESVVCNGDKKEEFGGFPAFPNQNRRLLFEEGSVTNSRSVKVTFEDGFSIEVPVSEPQG